LRLEVAMANTTRYFCLRGQVVPPGLLRSRIPRQAVSDLGSGHDVQGVRVRSARAGGKWLLQSIDWIAQFGASPRRVTTFPRVVHDSCYTRVGSRLVVARIVRSGMTATKIGAHRYLPREDGNRGWVHACRHRTTTRRTRRRLELENRKWGAAARSSAAVATCAPLAAVPRPWVRSPRSGPRYPRPCADRSPARSAPRC
jgi:hypothetical protein